MDGKGFNLMMVVWWVLFFVLDDDDEYDDDFDSSFKKPCKVIVVSEVAVSVVFSVYYATVTLI